MKSIVKVVAIFLIIGIAAGSFYFISRNEQTKQMLSFALHSFGPEMEFQNALKAIDHYRELIQQHPEETKNYVEFAQLLLQVMKSTGQRSEYLPTVQWLLDEALEREPKNFVALTTKAEVAANLHHFSEAKKYAEQSLMSNPYLPATYAVLIDANVELGKYDEAIMLSDKLQSIRPSMTSYTRAAYLRELHGDIEGAIQAMRLAADAGVTGNENRAWVLYQLGLLFIQDGKPDTAEFIFRGILQERPAYPNAHAGLGKIFKQKNNYEEAIIQYKAAIELLKEPAFYEELGDVYEVVGLYSNAVQCFDEAEKLYLQEKEVGEDNSVEMAMFYASHDRKLPEALELAREAVQRRPGIHAYQALALALFKNGKYGEAQQAVAQAMKLGTRDTSVSNLAKRIAEKINRA